MYSKWKGIGGEQGACVVVTSMGEFPPTGFVCGKHLLITELWAPVKNTVFKTLHLPKLGENEKKLSASRDFFLCQWFAFVNVLDSGLDRRTPSQRAFSSLIWAKKKHRLGLRQHLILKHNLHLTKHVSQKWHFIEAPWCHISSEKPQNMTRYLLVIIKNGYVWRMSAVHLPLS